MPLSFSAAVDFAPTPGVTLVPVAVRLSNTAVDKTIDVIDVRYSTVMPGGYDTATITLAVPVESSAHEIAHLTHCIVYDTRNLEVEWQGWLTVPARGGLVQQIHAVGGASTLEGRTKALTLVDQDLSRWVQARRSALPKGEMATGNNPGDSGANPAESIILKIPESYEIDQNEQVSARYSLADAGQEIARVAYAWDTGYTHSDFRIRNSVGGVVERDQAATTAGGALASISRGVDWTTTENETDLHYTWIGPDNTPLGSTGTKWASFFNVIVLAVRYLKDGTKKTSGYTTNYLLAHEAVGDVLGRRLTHIDGATATVNETSTVQLDQLAWPDGTTERHVLEDVISVIGDWYYAVWEWTQNRKWAFEFGPYSTSIAFELRHDEHQIDPPSGADPYNEAEVRWISPAGRVKKTVRTLAVAALTAAGLTRTMELDLGDQVGSTAQAAAAGDVALAVSQTPTTGGRAVITGPIHDRRTGRTLLPHQLPRHVAGQLVRVDVAPESLSVAPVRNGRDILRVVGAEYDSSTGCTLALDAQFEFTKRHAALTRAFASRRRR